MEPFLQGNKDGNEKGHLADKESDAELYHRDHRVCHPRIFPDRGSRLRIRWSLQVISHCGRLRGGELCLISKLKTKT